MLKSRRFWLGLILSLVFIGLFLYRVDLASMGQALRQANYLFVVPGILCYFLALWFRTVRWQYILRPLGYLSLRRLWPVMTVGYAANNLLPVRLGEVVRAYYLWERDKLSKTSTIATILLERLFDGLALLFLALVVSLFIPIAGLLKGIGEETGINWLALTLGLSVPFFATTAFLVVLAFFPEGVPRTVGRVLAFLPGPARRRAMDVVARFLLGLAVLRSPKRLLLIFLVSIPVWVAEAAMFFVIALGFRMDSAFTNWAQMAGAMILTSTIANLGTSVPSSGGGVGPFEFFAQSTLVLLGVTTAVASAYVVVLHVALLAPVTLWGMVQLWLDNVSLVRLAREGQRKESPPRPVGVEVEKEL
ncbi:MAG: flippase-like domain-containing protein [Chloroflexi bacterium]|nr:flippase-like domain-containing protein [Chloroflexota bacterium]